MKYARGLAAGRVLPCSVLGRPRDVTLRESKILGVRAAESLQQLVPARKNLA